MSATQGSRYSHVLGRGSILGLVCAGFVASFVVLGVRQRGGGISDVEQTAVVKEIFAIYVPLIALFMGFYFGAGSRLLTSKETSPGAFWLAIFLVAGWSLTPPLLIGLRYAEDALDTLVLIAPWCQGFAIAATAYYFGSEERAVEVPLPPGGAS